MPGGRLPDPVEQAAYFVVSEALANAAKHSAATSVTVDAQVQHGVLVVSVVDDGVGGADPEGAGLRGLADRVAAAGGAVRVASPPGGGTRLVCNSGDDAVALRHKLKSNLMTGTVERARVRPRRPLW